MATDDRDTTTDAPSASGTPITNSPTPVLSYYYANFTGGTGGANPNGNVLVDTAGDIFGTTQLGGTGDIGTIFEATGNPESNPNPPAPLTSFSNYAGAAGSSLSPGNLVMDSSGDLFGTTESGGTGKGAAGTIFELAKTSTGYQSDPSVLLTFRRGYAHGPENLTTDSQGDLIGTTTGIGASGNGSTVFEVAKTATGFQAKQTVLARFTGKEHVSSNLVTDASGNLIGAVSGGKAGTGEIFELQKTASGGFRKTPTIINSGVGVQNLAKDTSGNVFAVSSLGGAYNQGAIYQLGANGAATDIANFNGANGADPTGITLDNAGNIFGTTYLGGAGGYGSVYEIEKTATGYAQPITLKSFTGTGGAFPGANPVGSPTLNGGFVYGTTQGGGPQGVGELYVLNPVDAGGTISSDSTSAGPAVAEAAAIPAAATCFAGGTRIRTTRGEVAVEALAVGDLVVTASGARRAIRWLGHRTVDCRRHPRPCDVRPVRIAADAFGPSRPARDLVVSPGHAICVDVVGEVLIPAAALVEGASIVQLEVERVTYWHVELDSHDILLAENLPTESYLEMGNRGFFADGDVVALAAAPDARVGTHADFCRPFHASGPVVEAARAGLVSYAARKRPAAGTRRVS